MYPMPFKYKDISEYVAQEYAMATSSLHRYLTGCVVNHVIEPKQFDEACQAIQSTSVL